MKAVDGELVPMNAQDVNALLRASRVFAGITAESIAQAEAAVTLPQLRVLFLASTGQPLTATAVAQALDVHLSNASRICDRLVRAGYLARRESAVDRRTVDLSLTEAGRALVDSVTDHRQQVFAAILRHLPADRRGALADALTAFADVAEEHYERRFDTP